MILTLEVAGPQAAQLGAARRKSFRASGGVIGREKSSDWVLPHTKVSGRHARITCVDSVFYIEDTSKNGVFINSSRERLTPGRPRALKEGDRILIDPYEIQVSVTGEAGDVPRSGPAARARAEEPPGGFGAARGFDEDDPFAEWAPAAPQAPPRPAPNLDALAMALPGEELDPLKLLDPNPKRPPARQGPSAKDLERSSPLAAHYRPPAVRPAAPPPPAPPAAAPRTPGPLIPEGYDPLLDETPPDPGPSEAAPAIFDEPVRDEPPPPDPFGAQSFPSVQPADVPMPSLLSPVQIEVPPELPPPPAPLPAAAGAVTPSPSEVVSQPPAVPASPAGEKRDEVFLADVLAGAGLEGVAVTPELARHFGEILRVVVGGVMDILQARQQIKDEFRMRVTRFKVADNNPLKFSANVDDALHNLLVKRNEAYLGPVEAFEDAFRDLRHHQVALLAGMRVAFESMVADFDPDRLQEGFDRQIRRGPLGMPAKLRYWDLYRERCQEIARDPDTSFRKLFGEEFAKAYEAQLELLTSRKRENG